MGNGADNFQAGLRTMWNGTPTNTFQHYLLANLVGDKAATGADYLLPLLAGGAGAFSRRGLPCEEFNYEAQAYRAAEMRLKAYLYYKSQGWPDQRIFDHMNGIDFNQPVQTVVLPGGSDMAQWQVPGGTIGNYFGAPGTPPTGMGIAPNGMMGGIIVPKVESTYSVPQSTSALQSTASPVMDTWSTPPTPVFTQGGKTQYFSPGLSQDLRR